VNLGWWSGLVSLGLGVLCGIFSTPTRRVVSLLVRVAYVWCAYIALHPLLCSHPISLSLSPRARSSRPELAPSIGGAAFGIPISEICEYSFAAHRWQPPPVFSDTVRYVAKFGIKNEGIFRVSAPSAEVESFATAYDLGLSVNSSEFSDAHVASGLLKQWLRELPEPLIPFSMYDSLLTIASTYRM
jgi:RhoGAP domain